MEGSTLLTAILLFLFAAVVTVPIARRLGIGAVLGYLIAGIAIGPWGWALSVTLTRSCTFPNWAWCS